MPFGRRFFLLSCVAATATACARTTPRPPAPTAVALPPDFAGWNQEARGILSDGIETLRAFDVFQAFRVSTAAQSGARQANELVGDPTTSATWDEATHVTRGLRGRAQQLFESVTTTKIDPSLWREQRRLADATHDLLDLGDSLAAYRNRVDVLPPGDAGNGLSLLDRAWAQWDTAAARWAISRAESIDCAGASA